MKSTLLLAAAALVLCAALPAAAQENPAVFHCSKGKSLPAGKTAIAHPAEDDYDVKYVKLDLELTTVSNYVNGNVTTRAKVIAATMANYVFELNNRLTIDSVLINGALRPVSTTGDIRTVALAAPLAANTVFTAQVYYNGTPVNGSLMGGALGLNCLTSPSWGTRVTFNQSEAYKAKEWWPCKQSLQDKIDSADIWLTVPDTVKAGSNGTLVSAARVGATSFQYQWKERHPIDYYLISVAVAPYVDYSYYMHFTGSTDSMLVQNYVYNHPMLLPRFKSVIDSTGMMVDYFSTLFGRYPFWDEKYGHCMAPLNGGMEHQTMSTMGFFDAGIVAHELGHQWFGDHVTCATWADIFINEGFASYSQYLFADHFHNHFEALDFIKDQQNNVKSQDSGVIFVDDTTDEGRVFDGRLSYDKGSCVLHMLRSIIHNDSMYFGIYRTFQQTYKNGNGAIADFRDVAKGIAGSIVNGISLDTFFNQWTYQHGFPLYTLSWNQVGTAVYLRVQQSTSAPLSVPYFSVPFEVQVKTGLLDTIVRVNVNQPDQVFEFTWNTPITSIIPDPERWNVYKLNSLTKDPTLSVANMQAPALTIVPNPTAGNWTITGIAPYTQLDLTDIAGRTLWQTNSETTKQQTIPATHLPAGADLLRATTTGQVGATYKLIKQ
jgi:aminopeptidase N